MIEIMKASAGSGKTYSLTREYIRLLLETDDRYAYRHILAVTFTNKATEEMKTRILKELHVLATSPEESGYFGDFVPSLCADADALKSAASTCLCNILHDYSSFSISTIDRFFQQTLRAFAREIGHFASYRVELDRDSLLSEAVDRVLDSLTVGQKDKERLEWMTSQAIRRVESGRGYKVDGALTDIARRLVSEEFRSEAEKTGIDSALFHSRESLEEFSEACSRVCTSFLEELCRAADRVRTAFSEAGIDPYETKGHFMSKVLDKYVDPDRLADGGVPVLTESFLRSSEDVSSWFKAADRYKESMVTDSITGAIAGFVSMFGDDLKVYNTAALLKEQVYAFGVADDIYREFEALLKEKNVLGIDDSNKILKDIIDGTQAPFIYEKLGVRFEHFLLDEFQDTSLVQWDNFRPLLENSISENNYNLIVGDVKQSIYRWRNSEWQLLDRHIPEAFKDYVKENPLDCNWRSLRNIVCFNNDFFQNVARELDGLCHDEYRGVVSRIYRDVAQKAARMDGSEGFVRMTFCNPDGQCEEIYRSVMKARSLGYSYKDITILIRKNSQASLTAGYLMERGVPVITDDALRISSSLTVRRLVSLLKGIDNPEDVMAHDLSANLDLAVPSSWHSLTGLCEDILRRIRKADAETFDSETLYIQSFMDVVQDFVSMEGNSLRAFIKKWESDRTSVSSPSVGDSVRIMTIHKSKGLDFPYVICPFIDEGSLFSARRKWCHPQVEGTALAGVAEGVYDVNLSGKSAETLFDLEYMQEHMMQLVDGVNVMYVAFTRASEAMHLIGAYPQDKVRESASSGVLALSSSSTFADIAYWYAQGPGQELGLIQDLITEGDTEDFILGSMSAVDLGHKEPLPSLPLEFCSWPLDATEESEDISCHSGRGRLRLSSDSFDFFSEDGKAGSTASNRVRGIVLHDILSAVVRTGDLRHAVESAADSGALSREEVEDTYLLLERRIREVASYGWFPEDVSQVLNEADVVDVDGHVFRPDRVVISGGKVKIIDYKFGEHSSVYVRQLMRYAGLWRRMGYDDVQAFLWYVQDGNVVTVE